MRSALHKKFLPPFQGSGVAPDSLLTDLLAYWPLDEQSGFRYNATDPTAFSALFVNSNSEYFSGDLSILNLAGFASGKTFNFWLKPTLAFQGGIFGSATDIFRAIVAVTGAVTIYCYDADGNPAHYTQVDLIAGSIVANVWQMLTIWYDPADKKLHAAVNNGAVIDGNALVTTPKAMVDSSIFGSNTGGANFWDGNFSRTGVWSRVLTAPERTELYNSGRGKLFSQLSAGIQVGLVSYWNLGELSGNRADSFGANTLTDNNTVGADLDYPGILKLTDNNTVTYVNDGPRGVNASFVNGNTENLSKVVTLNLSTGFTISAWVKADRLGAGTNYVPFWSNNRAIELQVAGFVARILIHTASGFYTANAGAFDENWHLWTATYDGTTGDLICYIDGNAGVTTPTAGLLDNTDIIGIGYDAALPSDGTALESCVGVWNRVLSLPDIMALYKAGQGKRYSDLGPPEKVDLVSYWNLDEVDGNRADSHGANTLTDNNTVTSISTGPEQVVGSFITANSEYLSAGAVVDTSGDFTVALWARTPVGSTGYMLLFNIGPLANTTGLLLEVENAGNHRLYNDYSGGVDPIEIGDNRGNWILYLLKYIKSTNTTYIMARGSAISSNVWSAGNVLNLPASTVLEFGRRTAGTLYFEGMMGDAGYWTKALSAAEVTELFNSGVGKKYSELSAGIKTNLVSYWNLTELSGNRADSHGANTLTDNNTVMSVINMPDVADKVAARFLSANTEYLSNVTLVPGLTTSSMIIWFNQDILGGASKGIIKLGEGTLNASHCHYQAYTDGGDLLYVEAYSDAYDNTHQFPQPPAGTWAMLYLAYDGVAKLTKCSLNAGTLYQSAAPHANVVTADKVLLGCAGTDVLGDCKIDEVMLYSRELTQPEITRLFNLGKGVFYPTFT